MGRLVYAAIASADGYVVDADGSFAWAAPDEEVHAAVNELERAVGTQLYGRRMYEVLKVWQDMGQNPDDPAVIRDFAQLWRAADKVVYSSSLAEVTTPRTRLERTFDRPSVQSLKNAVNSDVSIGGPTLAARAFAEHLIDEVHLFLHPVAVGGGTPALPPGQRVALELLHERRFSSGVVHLHYRVI